MGENKDVDLFERLIERIGLVLHADSDLELADLKVIIENYPDGESEEFVLPHHPKVDLGGRAVPFSRELFIERADFAQTPPPKWKRESAQRMIDRWR